ncbi:MAG: DUF2275 domain-containing protein [Deltaproteobacteria bacterium]
MKNCKNIENSLSLYAEGLLPDAEKMAAEKHLAECADCSKALADLKKVVAMTQGLQEVEPPPWFKQRIMARVREEAEKKSFAQKWFYPLRIKIPIQVMATIVIAILAVYIYRSGDEQMKAIVPQAPQLVMEAQQEPTPVEIPKAKKAAPALLAEEKKEVIGAAKKDKVSEVSSVAKVLKMEKQGNKLAGTSDKSPARKVDVAAEKEEKKPTELSVLREAPQKFAARQESMQDRGVEDSSLSGAAKMSRVFKAAAPAKPAPMAASVTDQVQPVISVYVANVNSAVVEAEKILTKHNAKKVTKKLVAGKTILKAEIPAKNLKDILSQLRGLGRVEAKGVPADGGEKDVNLVIEIKNE